MSSGLSLVRLVPLAVIALFAGLGATVLLARAGEVRLIGYLRAEQSVVYAPHSGRVEAVQARSGESIKPRQPLIQLADESLDREISVKSREVTSLQASLEQCRAKAEVEMSLQRKDVDDALLPPRGSRRLSSSARVTLPSLNMSPCETLPGSLRTDDGWRRVPSSSYSQSGFLIRFPLSRSLFLKK